MSIKDMFIFMCTYIHIYVYTYVIRHVTITCCNCVPFPPPFFTGASELVMPPPLHPHAMKDYEDLDQSRASSASNNSSMGGRCAGVGVGV